MNDERVASLINFLLPGVGLVLAGRLALGVVLGLTFTVGVCVALAGAFLMPDDLDRRFTLLTAGAGAGVYVAAQHQMQATRREARRRTIERKRRERLHAALSQLKAGDAGQARATLAALMGDHPHDLLIAYRHAQACLASGDAPAAQQAWDRVRRLDPHGLYRAEELAARAQLAIHAAPT